MLVPSGSTSDNSTISSILRDFVKVVLDRQPLLGTGPLPDWLRNLAHSRYMLTLDTHKDNLCLWRCIAVHRGSRPDRSTTAAREFAKSFFNLIAIPQDCQKNIFR